MTEANCDKRHASNWKVIGLLVTGILAVGSVAGASFQKASNAEIGASKNEIRIDNLEKHVVEKLDDILNEIRNRDSPD